MADTILLGQPDSIEHRWSFWNGGPLSTDADGRAMRVEQVEITVFPNGEPTQVRLTGHLVKANGERDKRSSWSVLSFDEDLDARVLAEFEAQQVVA